MSLATWVDSRTLLGCDLLIASIYSCAFFGMRQFYPRLRGAGSFATSYVLVAAAFILYIARNDMPHFVSIVGANALIFASCIFFLQGIFRFFDIKKTLYPAISWFVLATLLIGYFTVVHDNIVDRTAIIGISVFLLRGQAAVELYRQSSARPVIRLFSYVTGSCALLGLSSAIFVFVVPDTLMHFESRQILALILAFASFCSLGLFLLFMLSSELLSLVQDESQQDILTGILNRRGVDLKLALELKRINRSGQKLSIAFIDIDHFKAVNDSSGHAGGDEALRQVSTLIAGRLRAYDLLGRYGGDEFLLVLPQTSWPRHSHGNG